MSDENIWTDEWDPGDDWAGGGGRSKRLPRGSNLGASVYELDPGNWAIYHFHHGSEELMVVLRGRPMLRTGATSRQLEEGDVVHFPTGPRGRSWGLERDGRAGAVLDGVHTALPRGSRVSRLEAAHGPGAHDFADGRAPVVDPRRRPVNRDRFQPLGSGPARSSVIRTRTRRSRRIRSR